MERTIEQVDDSRERGCFAAAGGAAHEQQSARHLGQFGDDRWQMQFVKRADRKGDYANHQARRSAMAVEIAAEPRDARQAVRKVEALEECVVDVVEDRARSDRTNELPQLVA